MKKCPFCGEEIQDIAKKCPHCKNWIENGDEENIQNNVEVIYEKCPYCGEEILKNAQKCKHCGEWLNKEKPNKQNESQKKPSNPFTIVGYGCLGLIGLFIFLCIICIIFSPSDTSSNAKEYQCYEAIDVGYMEYEVRDVKWQNYIGDKYINQKANSKYLLINISAKNKDSQSRLVPSFTLVNSNGNTYESSDDSIYLGDKAFILESLNPNVTKNGWLVFDVPEDDNYKLVISGGFFSADEARVVLFPDNREQYFTQMQADCSEAIPIAKKECKKGDYTCLDAIAEKYCKNWDIPDGGWVDEGQ